jgi:hypothetical protein
MAVALLAAALLLSGCGKGAAPKAAKAPRSEDFSWGPVHAQFVIDPGSVDLTREMQLTVTVTAPPDLEITLPALNDRLQGFSLNGSFEDEPETREGKKVRTIHYQLTPLVAERYRIAPMAVEYTDHAVNPPQKGWYPTRPIVLEKAALTQGEPGSHVTAQLDPVWIFPSFRTVSLWVLLGLLLVAAGFGVWKLVTRVRESVQLARMSPRERALKELAKLLSKDLVRKNKVKEFYLELTMIVRRYIERSHGIRAPEQTTEEFLAAVSKDQRFLPEVVSKLRAFLQAADLVKFAAFRPDEMSIGQATGTAKDYIEHDAAEAAAAAAKP